LVSLDAFGAPRNLYVPQPLGGFSKNFALSSIRVVDVLLSNHVELHANIQTAVGKLAHVPLFMVVYIAFLALYRYSVGVSKLELNWSKVGMLLS